MIITLKRFYLTDCSEGEELLVGVYDDLDKLLLDMNKIVGVINKNMGKNLTWTKEEPNEFQFSYSADTSSYTKVELLAEFLPVNTIAVEDEESI